jgi:hypothetical protein
LKCLGRSEHQRQIGSAIGSLARAQPVSLLFPNTGRNPLAGPIKARLDQIRMHLFGRSPLAARRSPHLALLVARLALLRHQPASQLFRKRIQLARPVQRLKLRLNDARPQVFLDPSAIGLEPKAPQWL